MFPSEPSSSCWKWVHEQETKTALALVKKASCLALDVFGLSVLSLLARAFSYMMVLLGLRIKAGCLCNLNQLPRGIHCIEVDILPDLRTFTQRRTFHLPKVCNKVQQEKLHFQIHYSFRCEKFASVYL